MGRVYGSLRLPATVLIIPVGAPYAQHYSQPQDVATPSSPAWCSATRSSRKTHRELGMNRHLSRPGAMPQVGDRVVTGSHPGPTLCTLCSSVPLALGPWGWCLLLCPAILRSLSHPQAPAANIHTVPSSLTAATLCLTRSALWWSARLDTRMVSAPGNSWSTPRPSVAGGLQGDAV